MTEEKVRHLTPVGRLIHESLFEKDQYTTDKGKDGDPAYKIEVAFDRDDVEGEGTLEDALIDAVVAEWGEAAEQQFLDGKIRSCLIDGDELKARREEKGKSGDAYSGQMVMRASTKFNKHGMDAPGGVQVYDEDVQEIGPATRDQIYPGCYVQLGVVFSCYDVQGKGVKAYLIAVQKTGDGDKLVSQADHSTLFKATPRSEGDRVRRSRGRG